MGVCSFAMLCLSLWSGVRLETRPTSRRQVVNLRNDDAAHGVMSHDEDEQARLYAKELKCQRQLSRQLSGGAQSHRPNIVPTRSKRASGGSSSEAVAGSRSYSVRLAAAWPAHMNFTLHLNDDGARCSEYVCVNPSNSCRDWPAQMERNSICIISHTSWLL